jgi:hypothetical protein
VTPAEHHAEAERLLERAYDLDLTSSVRGLVMAAAQVHATLATVHPPVLPPTATQEEPHP